MHWIFNGLCAAILTLAPAAAQERASADFVLHWEKSFPKQEKPGTAGFQIIGAARLSDGSLALLAFDAPKEFLFLGADERGIGREKVLPRNDSWAFRMNSGQDDLWLSGYANEWMFVPGDSKRDGYLAKYDSNGDLIWERTYGWWDFRMITDVVQLPSGELAVAGAHGMRRGWIAKLDQSGSLLWEHDIGLPNRIEAVDLPEARIAVVAFSRADQSVENVVVWIFDADGALLKRNVVRQRLISALRSGDIAATATRDGILVLSMWTGEPHPLGAELAKIDRGGEIVWKTQLPEASFDSGENWEAMCKPSLVVLSDGDAVVACLGPSGELLFYRVDEETGAVSVTSATLPDCRDGRRNAEIFLVRRNERSIWVVGSLKPFENGRGCTWLGELSVAN